MRAGHCHCLKALHSVHLGHQIGLQHSFDSNGSHPCTFTLSATALIHLEALEAGDIRRMGFFLEWVQVYLNWNKKSKRKLIFPPQACPLGICFKSHFSIKGKIIRHPMAVKLEGQYFLPPHDINEYTIDSIFSTGEFNLIPTNPLEDSWRDFHLRKTKSMKNVLKGRAGRFNHILQCKGVDGSARLFLQEKKPDNEKFSCIQCTFETCKIWERC